MSRQEETMARGEGVARQLLLLLRMSNFACKLPMSGPGLESLSKPQPESFCPLRRRRRRRRTRTWLDKRYATETAACHKLICSSCCVEERAAQRGVREGRRRQAVIIIKISEPSISAAVSIALFRALQLLPKGEEERGGVGGLTERGLA